MANRDWSAELGFEPSLFERKRLEAGTATIEDIRRENEEFLASLMQPEEEQQVAPQEEAATSRLPEEVTRPSMGDYLGSTVDVAKETFKSGAALLPNLYTAGRLREVQNASVLPEPPENLRELATYPIDFMANMPFRVGDSILAEIAGRDKLAAEADIYEQALQGQLSESLPAVIEAEKRNQEIAKARNPGFWERSAGNALASAPSYAPLLGNVIGGLLGGRAGSVIGAAALAPLPAIQAAAQSALQAERKGLRGEEAKDYVEKQTMAEFWMEAIAPKAATSVLGTVLKRMGMEQLSEQGTLALQTATDATTPGMEDQVPKDFGEYAGRMADTAGATLFGAALPSVIGARKATEDRLAEDSKRSLLDPDVTLEKTGDPDFDAALELDKAVHDNVLKEASVDFGDVSLDKIFSQEFKQSKYSDNSIIKPTPTEVEATPIQDDLTEQRRQLFEQQQAEMGRPRVPSFLWEGTARQEAEQALSRLEERGVTPPATSTSLTPMDANQIQPEMTFNNEFRPPSRLQARENLGLRDYSEATGRGTGPIPRMQAGTEGQVLEEAPTSAPSMLTDRVTLPPMQQGYQLQTGKGSRMDKQQPKAAVTKEQLLARLNATGLAPARNIDLDEMSTTLDEIDNPTPEAVEFMKNGYESMAAPDAPVKAWDVLNRALSDPRTTPELAQKIKFLLRHSAVKNTNVVIASNTGPYAEQMANRLASYQAVSPGVVGTAVLRGTSWGKSGLHPVAIVHELSHAASSTGLLDAARGVGTERALEAAKGLRELVAQLRDKANGYLKGLSEATGQTEEGVLVSILKNERELLAYTFSDPKVQNYLRGKPSIWNKILNAVADLLGWNKNRASMTLLDQVMGYSYQMMLETNNAERAAITARQEQRTRQAPQQDESITLETQPDEEITLSSEPDAMADLTVKEKPRKVSKLTKKPKPKVVPKPKFTQAKEVDKSNYPIIRDIGRILFQSGRQFGEIIDPDILRLWEESSQEKVAELYASNALWQKLGQLFKKVSPKVLDKALTGDKPTLASLTKKQREAVRDILNKRDEYSKAIIAEYLRGVDKISEEDLAALNKAVENLTDPVGYFHRQYVKDIKQKNIGKKRIKSLLENKDNKDPTNKYAEAWRKAQEYIIREEMTIPADLNKRPLHNLQRMYEHWTGLKAGNLSKNELVKKLNAFRTATPEQMKSRAEAIIKELLGVQNTDSVVTKYYGGSKLDKTILTPRSPIAPEIRELFGEITNKKVALLATLNKQAGFLAQLKFLNTLKELGMGEFLFDPSAMSNAPEQVTETLDDESYGPLNGLKTTKTVKRTLDALLQMNVANEFYEATAAGEHMMKVLTSIRDAIPGPVSNVKLIRLIFSGARWAFNFLSGPGIALANGNFLAMRPKYLGKVLKNFWGLTTVTSAKEVKPFVKEMLNSGMYDSALFGEITADSVSDFVYEFLSSTNPRQTLGDKIKGMIRDSRKAGHTVWETFKNAYALMDVVWKMSNYLYEVDAMAKIYPDSTVEEQKKMAAERIKLTNYTWNRAGPILKLADKYGVQMFAVFLLSEVPRTLYNNLLLGATDLATGTKEGNQAQAIHGLKRLAGAGMASTAYGKAVGLLLGSIAGLDILGDEDDEEKRRKGLAIQRAMNEGDKSKLVLPYDVDARGRLLGFDVSALDPHSSLTDIIRTGFGVASGTKRPEELWEDVKNLFFMNSLVGTVTDRGLRPSMATKNESLYQERFNMWARVGAPPDLANRLIYLEEQVTPPVISGLMRKAASGEDVTWPEAFGVRPVVFDPKKAIFDVARFRNGVVVGKRSELAKKIINSGLNLSVTDLHKFYSNAVAEELEAFNKMQDKIAGARAMGVPDAVIAQKIFMANTPQRDIQPIMDGVFIPKTFSEEFLVQAQNEAWLGDKPKEERKKIVIALEASKRILYNIWYQDTRSRLEEQKRNAN